MLVQTKTKISKNCTCAVTIFYVTMKLTFSFKIYWKSASKSSADQTKKNKTDGIGQYTVHAPCEQPEHVSQNWTVWMTEYIIAQKYKLTYFSHTLNPNQIWCRLCENRHLQTPNIKIHLRTGNAITIRLHCITMPSILSNKKLSYH